MTCLRHKIRTARTPKPCHGCGLRIRPGDRYADTVYVEPGHGPYSWPSHAECYAEAERLCTNPMYCYDEGIGYGALRDDGEVWREDLSPEYLAWLATREAQR